MVPFSIRSGIEVIACLHVAKRRNIMDTYYLGAQDATARHDDLKTLFTTELTTLAKKMISKYGIDYILLTNHGKKFYNIKNLPYQEKCIKLIYQNEESEIYSAEC